MSLSAEEPGEHLENRRRTGGKQEENRRRTGGEQEENRRRPGGEQEEYRRRTGGASGPQVMARSERDVINFSALESELQAALQADGRHARENAAKLRAVSQGGSYQEFRDLVLASHLRPLERKDKDGGRRRQPWNPVAPGNS